MGYLSKLPVIRRGGQNRQYYLICPAPLAAALEMEKGETLEPQICVKGHWEHGKTPVEMDLLSHKYSPATFHPAGEKLPNGHLCNLSLQNLNIGEQETLIQAFLRFNAIFCHQFCGVGVIPGHAGGGDGLAGLDAGGDFEIQGEELGEQVLFRGKAVGGEGGGVEGGGGGCACGF